VRNAASIRAFEKAGFRRWRIVDVPGEPAPEQLLRIERRGLRKP
jgi:RimJ/RimL family protein N-acetyltransferase